MRYERMFLGQLERAKNEHIPFLLPVGTIEYHGPHCAYGCDGLIAEGIAHRLEARIPAVVLPTVWYGSSSYAVGGPEKGTIHVDAEILGKNFGAMFESLLEGGVRNIVVLIHHQFEQENYMPMTLAAASAAKTSTMSFLERTRGRGWWGDNRSAGYYTSMDEGDNPFNWIRVFPCMSKAAQNATGYDHAGKYECSLLAALYPETVSLERVAETDEWFAQSAAYASVEYGEHMLEISLTDLLARIA